jgi:hypothetical protein
VVEDTMIDSIKNISDVYSKGRYRKANQEWKVFSKEQNWNWSRSVTLVVLSVCKDRTKVSPMTTTNTISRQCVLASMIFLEDWSIMGNPWIRHPTHRRRLIEIRLGKLQPVLHEPKITKLLSWSLTVASVRQYRVSL